MPEISRRAFGGLVGGGAVTAVAGTAATAEATEAATVERPFEARPATASGRRPNVLVVLGDDLGWADLSSYGAPHIRTPNLDRLARQGVRFTDAYSGSATCSPTRFSLYTGRYPGRTPGGLAEPIANRTQGLDPNHPTLASLLKKAGYATALIGKWHCGWLPDHSPTKSGWDEFFGNFGGVLEYFSKLGQLGTYDLYEGDAEYKDLRYYTDVLTERAVEYVGRRHDRPWLLNLNFTTPHWPWLAEDDQETGAEIAARIRAAKTQAEVSRALNHYDGGSVEKYTQMVESLDAAVGEVLAALRRSGQEENTVVLFASDNGGERYSYNWPLRGEKFVLLEGGIRVPTILRWPARIDGRQVSHEPVFTPDWTATLLELGGARPEAAYPLDGTSLAGHLLRGEDVPERDLFWRVRANRALRRGDWKYYRDAAGADHLYNLAADSREQADLAPDRPELLTELRTAWEGVAAGLLPYPAA
ncbi:sulfatase family protein [Streptomyces europaeiscabiei]|uniref:Sulfatase-like hydrolase/transferase n=1 Tax=Streptomyces europaeiscabiei TaxID=146819 RepID=A0ABU4NSM7_9ACTN|nr:sulfatase-like hydrolase/transferase [Streptomyces europaeiscabiei]MDX2531132.1 sulfatase-like hydrolase/transferase [Streptomyces europaeiscabiei]MDX2759247.1 sulfatase-like hydrolase/transferase [Streptomyces europaeiscabiei]MDX2769572.1 sulfatase-like hydrolase/transferase [Streptomyces europaeiscabiei]MDX3549932.1 sulfatase-like hydrolase/transferase [Streptomyces europaeiscabiei]MDX3557385.1 sulfatase-like hydrolase/transferase [Streptomyces europaeiscabiei]